MAKVYVDPKEIPALEVNEVPRENEAIKDLEESQVCGEFRESEVLRVQLDRLVLRAKSATKACLEISA